LETIENFEFLISFWSRTYASSTKKYHIICF